ncbi:MAG TPA: DNA polymerase III subunit chi [Burkholderiaceae bacterium]|nr:DNA polymerase III subunit chi [Burkholderiaceae bacterium]
MTEVMFHLRVADQVAYACRLLRKAHARDARVVVCAPARVLAELDALLWTADPASFLPHVRLPADAASPAPADPTPIWLVERTDQAPARDVLVNLGNEIVAGFETFARLIEIVPEDEAATQAARRRWKYYADRGYALAHHEARA